MNSGEFDMFSLPLRLAHRAHANGAKRIIGPRVAGTVAIGAAVAFWLALIAALFVTWAMPPSVLTGSSPGCVFMGKGGIICNGSASSAQEITSESDSCTGFGRNGHYCPPTK
jgi:hypothetical protein